MRCHATHATSCFRFTITSAILENISNTELVQRNTPIQPCLLYSACASILLLWRYIKYQNLQLFRGGLLQICNISQTKNISIFHMRFYSLLSNYSECLAGGRGFGELVSIFYSFSYLLLFLPVLASSCGFSGLACFKLSCIRQHRTTLMQIMQNIQKPPIPIKYCSILPIVCILFTLLLSIDSK